MATSARSVAFGMVLLLGLAACQPASGSVPPTATGSPRAPSPAPTAAGSNAPTGGPSAQTGQTDTPWGRIWDTLPAGFPAYPGSTPAEQAATGPATAVLAIQGADARTVADWMRSKLESASYSTEALSGPLEDGSLVLDSTGPAPGCRVQVSIAPLGGLTTVTVLYGAGCPKP